MRAELARAQEVSELRNGWPATEWETGPEPKMAGEMAGEMAGGHFRGCSKMAEQIGRTNGWTAKIWPLFGCPAILEHPRKLAAGHFSGHFWFWARFPFCSRPAISQCQNQLGNVFVPNGIVVPWNPATDLDL